MGKQGSTTPIPLLIFSGRHQFFNYWLGSGSISFIREYLRDHRLTAQKFANFKVTWNFASDPEEIENTTPAGFLYQAGYLSLRKTEDDIFLLDYPNFEVLSSMHRLFMDNLLAGTDQDLMRLNVDLREHHKSGNVPMIVDNLRRMYAGVNNADQPKVSWNLEKPDDYTLFVRQTQGDNFYLATLHSYLLGSCLDTNLRWQTTLDPTIL
jgi:hypothetical protein